VSALREVLAAAALVAGKDLRIEARSRVATNHVLPFVAVVVMLFAFALDTEATTLRRAAGGLFWVTVVFAAVLVVQRGAQLEQQDGAGEALRLSGLRPAGVFLGKGAALFVELMVVEVVLAVAMVVLYDLRLGGVVLLVVTAVVATAAIAAAGAIYGPLVAGLSGRETVLPLLLLPVLAPVLLAASRAFEVALGRGVGSGWPWVGMLGMLCGIYVVLGALTSGPLLDET